MRNVFTRISNFFFWKVNQLSKEEGNVRGEIFRLKRIVIKCLGKLGYIYYQ